MPLLVQQHKGISHMDIHDLTQLGLKAEIPQNPNEAKLEFINNPHEDSDYLIRFTCPEFTTLCPITGQPDFAHLVFDYFPAKFIIESKSFKLFLTAYRNQAKFHEDCTVSIGKRLIEAIGPKWIRVAGYWFPRGGMPIDIHFQQGEIPLGQRVPETGVDSYRGRG